MRVRVRLRVRLDGRRAWLDLLLGELSNQLLIFICRQGLFREILLRVGTWARGRAGVWVGACVGAWVRAETEWGKEREQQEESGGLPPTEWL